jgi:hypothetical protein
MPLADCVLSLDCLRLVQHPISKRLCETRLIDSHIEMKALSSRTMNHLGDAISHKPKSTTAIITSTISTCTSRKNTAQLRLLYQSVEKIIQLELQQQGKQESALIIDRTFW